jgi:hypothetical protein
MTTTASPAPARAPLAARFGLIALTVPAGLGLGVLAALALGPLALVVPFFYAGAVCACVVHGRRGGLVAGVREVVAGVLGAAGGFGFYVFTIVVGIGAGVLPFLDNQYERYPHMDEWTAASRVVSVLAALALWWLLRRWGERTSSR